MDCIPKEIIQEEIIKSWIVVKCSLDISKKPGSDDATTPPHESNSTIIEVPTKLLGSLPEQHEPLCIGYNLTGIQCLTDCFNKLLLVSFILCLLWSMEYGACFLPFFFARTQASIKYCHSNRF